MISTVLKNFVTRLLCIQPDHLKKMSERLNTYIPHELVKVENHLEIIESESDISHNSNSFSCGIKKISQNTPLNVYTYVEQNVCLHGEIGVNRKGRIITELLAAKGKGLFARFPIYWTTYIRAWLYQFLPTLSQPLDCAILLTTPFGDNYYHCVVDIVLRLPSYIFVRNSLVPPPIFIATTPLISLPSFYQEFLSILGIEMLEQRYVRAKNLVVASPARVGFTYSNSNIEHLRHLACKSLDINQTSKKERIYITRRHARSRRVINEDEVILLMRKWNFNVYELETLNVAEQILLFSNASIVVGPHGAGLTNIIFSYYRVLIELLPEDDFVSWGHFASLCLSIGGTYRYVLGEVLDYSACDIWPKLDFTVSLLILEAVITEIIKSD